MIFKTTLHPTSILLKKIVHADLANMGDSAY